MILTFLRRFGAALVFSTSICGIATPAAFATEPEASGDAKSDAATSTKPADAKSDAATSTKPGDTKSDAALSTKPTGESTPDAAAKPKPGAPSSVTRPTSVVRAREEAEREGRRHGARSKSPDGTMIIWDNVNSVWLVPEPKNTYWVVDRYYRFDEGIWLTAKLVAGPWELTRQHMVPEAPRDRHSPPKVSVTAMLPSGQEAIYEPRLKVFKVGGRKGVFLFDGVFYRYDGGVWLDSRSVDGPWAAASASALPQPLRRALPAAEKGARVTLPSGEILVSEGQADLFAVDGRPDAIYYDGWFYERRDQKWFKSASSSSGWDEVTSQKIPGPVRSNYHKDADRKGGGKDKARNKKDRAGKGGNKKSGAAKKKEGGEKEPGQKAGAKKKQSEEEAE